jgi:cytochrome P450
MPSQQDAVAFPFPSSRNLWGFPEEYAELREKSPVARVRLPNGLEAWLLTRYADVRRVLTEPVFSRQEATQGEAAKLTPAKILNSSLIGLDPPDHTRLRRLVANAFTTRRVESLRSHVLTLVDELLDEMERQPRPVDLNAYFCDPLPILVICELLGVPASDREQFRVWTEQSIGGREYDRDVSAAGYQSLIDYFDRLVIHKTAHPDDSLITDLINVRDHGDRLSHEELVAMPALILAAGYETTATLFSFFSLNLLHEEGRWRSLAQEPSRIPNAIEELLRTIGGTEFGGSFPRVAKEDVRFGDVLVRKGEVLIPCVDAANRDPEFFDDPESIDLGRDIRKNPHMTFGKGIHLCLGEPLARVEFQEGFHRLITRFPEMRLGIPDDRIQLKPAFAMRRLKSLPVEW